MKEVKLQDWSMQRKCVDQVASRFSKGEGSLHCIGARIKAERYSLNYLFNTTLLICVYVCHGSYRYIYTNLILCYVIAC